jgi:hypothetical protein
LAHWEADRLKVEQNGHLRAKIWVLAMPEMFVKKKGGLG